MQMKNHVFIIGGGIAGAEAAAQLATLGIDVTLAEKESQLGGKLNKWDRLFPSKRKATEVIDYIEKNLIQSNARILYNTEIRKIVRENGGYAITTNHEEIMADAILLATGYELFNAQIKEEYGYGIYGNVITSVELEEMFKKGNKLLTSKGEVPKRIGFFHCVGSRDEKVGNPYCSQVCCVTAVKQAMEVKEILPRVEVFCFYMDLRMFGLQFEELYREAQERWGVNFIRGRVSEAAENIDETILIKVEDTLSGRPLKMKTDLLVLMVGFIPSAGTKKLGAMLNLDFTPEGFLKPADEHLDNYSTSLKGVFVAGTCKSPKTIADTFADAGAAVLRIQQYLHSKEHKS
jgi:heterodisulfide reductase subunit A2